MGRVSATYLLTSRWSLGSTLSFDLLGRGSDLIWTNGPDYRYRLWRDSELRAAAGVTYGNATHLNSYYGVPIESVTPHASLPCPQRRAEGGGCRSDIDDRSVTPVDRIREPQLHTPAWPRGRQSARLPKGQHGSYSRDRLEMAQVRTTIDVRLIHQPVTYDGYHRPECSF